MTGCYISKCVVVTVRVDGVDECGRMWGEQYIHIESTVWCVLRYSVSLRGYCGVWRVLWCVVGNMSGDRNP